MVENVLYGVLVKTASRDSEKYSESFIYLAIGSEWRRIRIDIKRIENTTALLTNIIDDDDDLYLYVLWNYTRT